MQIQTVHGAEYLYVTTTTTNEIYRLALDSNTIAVFADPATTDLATGGPAGSEQGLNSAASHRAQGR